MTQNVRQERRIDIGVLADKVDNLAVSMTELSITIADVVVKIDALTKKTEVTDIELKHQGDEFTEFKNDRLKLDEDIHATMTRMDKKVDSHLAAEERYQHQDLEYRKLDAEAHRLLSDRLDEVHQVSMKTLAYVEKVDLAQQPVVTAWNNLSGWAKINKSLVDIGHWLVPLVVGIGMAALYFAR